MVPVPQEEYVTIIRGLASKTREGRIAWKKDQASSDAFRFSSPEEKFSLSLSFSSPRAEPDYIELEVSGPSGESAGKWRVWEGDDNWQLALDLYSEAYRFVHGSDKVFEEVKRFIAST